MGLNIFFKRISVLVQIQDDKMNLKHRNIDKKKTKKTYEAS